MPETLIAGRYRLDELLGRGGMSEVWAAQDLELGRRVAIKLLAPDADTARFEREARAFASLGHPNVTQLFDYGEENGRPYMVLEYVPGGTLEDRLRDARPLPDDETLAIAAGVAAGLAHAHARGVVHRDLKPSNVLFDAEGRPKLADFGIARLAAGEGTLTEAGTVLGTAAYISPEQAGGLPATAASDVYSFGVMLYRMLTGRLPFEAADPMTLVMQHRDAEPPAVSALRPDAPAALEATVAAALAKDPRHRPRDGAALLAELGVPAGVSAGTATAGTLLVDDATRVIERQPTAAPAAAGPPGRRRGPVLVVALAALALAGAVVAWAVTRSTSSPGDTGTFTPVTLPSASTGATSTSTAATTTAQTTTTAASTTTPTTAPTTTARTTAPTTTFTPPTTTTAPPPTTTAPPPTTTTVPTTAGTTTGP